MVSVSLRTKNNIRKKDRSNLVKITSTDTGLNSKDFSRKFGLGIQRNSKVRIGGEMVPRKVSVPIVILPFGRLIIIGCRPDWKVEISKLSIPRALGDSFQANKNRERNASRKGN